MNIMDKVDVSTGGGLIAILLWSTTIAMARSLAEQLGSLTAATCVYLIGGGLGLLRLWWVHTPWRYFQALSRKYMIGCGFLFVLYTVLLYMAVGLAKDREQVLEIGLINYLWPSFTLLLSLWLLNQRAQALLVPGTLLALGGVYLVMTQGGQVSWRTFIGHWLSNPVAYSLALVAAASWALYSNLTRRWSTAGSRGAVELFILGAGLILLVMRLLTTEATSWKVSAVSEAGVLGGITIVAYALWDLAMRKGNLLLVAASSYFTPLFSTLVSCLYLKVTPGSRLWAGCGLIVAGSLLSWFSITDEAPTNEKT